MKKHILSLNPVYFLFSFVMGIMMLSIHTFSNIYDDNILYYYRRKIPLGTREIYYIKTNEKLTTSTGYVKLEHGKYYYIQPVGVNQSTQYLDGYQVGSTEVDLEDYLGKSVYIIGKHYIGHPMERKPATKKLLRTNRDIYKPNSPVIHIENIYLSNQCSI